MIQPLLEWKWHASLLAASLAICAAFWISTPATSAGEDMSITAPRGLPETVVLDPARLQAQAAALFDPASGQILFEKNAFVPLPLASLTKLMAADVVLADQNPKSVVAIGPEETQQINDRGDLGLHSGEKWAVSTLVRYGLYASSNNAMLAAAALGGEAATVGKMNARARDLGLETLQYYNATGLDMSSSVAGGYGSARDVALLAAEFYRNHPVYFEETMRKSVVFSDGTSAFVAEATAAPIADIPGVLAAKTGYTDLSLGNMVALFDADLGHPLVAVVLHSTKNGRFEDIRTLINAARSSR